MVMAIKNLKRKHYFVLGAIVSLIVGPFIVSRAHNNDEHFSLTPVAHADAPAGDMDGGDDDDDDDDG